jgi:hypothetical protein
MIKARNVKWGMVVADVLRAVFASPGDPISLDEYSNSPREAAPSGEWAGFEVQIVSQMSETKTDDMRGDLCHPCSKIVAWQVTSPAFNVFAMAQLKRDSSRRRAFYIGASSPSHVFTHSDTSPFGPSAGWIPCMSSQSRSCCSNVFAVNSDFPLPLLPLISSFAVVSVPEAVAFGGDRRSSCSAFAVAPRMTFGLTFAFAFAACLASWEVLRGSASKYFFINHSMEGRSKR